MRTIERLPQYDLSQIRSSRSLPRFLAYAKPYFGILSLAIIFGIARYLIPLVLPWTIKILVDDYFHPESLRTHTQLHALMIGLSALYGIHSIVSYWRSYLAGLAGHRIIFDLRQALYLHVQRMSLSFFDRQRIGEVVSRMTTDIASAQNFVGAAFVNTVMDLSCVIVIIALLLFANLKLALISLLVLPFYAVVSFHLQKRIRLKSRSMHRQLQEISGDWHE